MSWRNCRVTRIVILVLKSVHISCLLLVCVTNTRHVSFLVIFGVGFSVP